MSIQRINAILVHTWYHFTHSMESWVDLLWNPAVQILVFAFIGKSLSTGADQVVAQYMILGMIFWNVIWIGQYAIAVGALWEIWSASFNTMFVTPMTLEEFLIGQVIGGLFKSVLAIIVTAIFGLAVFHVSVLSLSFMLPIYFLELYLFSCSFGMVVLGLIVRFGKDVQSLSWALIFLVQPLGAVFYPVSVLSPQLQIIAWGLPTTYVFEAMRHQLTTGDIRGDLLIWGTILNIIYLVIGYVALRFFFRQAKDNGMLAKLEE